MILHFRCRGSFLVLMLYDAIWLQILYLFKIEDSRSNSAPATPITTSQDSHPFHAVNLVPRETPDSASAPVVSSATTPSVPRAGASQISLPLNTALLTSCSQVMNVPVLSKPIISFPSSAIQNILPLNSPSPSSSFTPVSSQTILPISSSVAVPMPFNSTEVSSGQKKNVPVCSLSSGQSLSLPSQGMQNSMTEPTQTNLTMVTVPLSMPVIFNPISSQSQVSDLPLSLPSQSEMAVSGSVAVSGSGSESEMDTIVSSRERSPVQISTEALNPSPTGQCISPDKIEPTVKMKRTENTLIQCEEFKDNMPVNNKESEPLRL